VETDGLLNLRGCGWGEYSLLTRFFNVKADYAFMSKSIGFEHSSQHKHMVKITYLNK